MASTRYEIRPEHGQFVVYSFVLNNEREYKNWVGESPTHEGAMAILALAEASK